MALGEVVAVAVELELELADLAVFERVDAAADQHLGSFGGDVPEAGDDLAELAGGGDACRGDVREAEQGEAVLDSRASRSRCWARR